MTFELLSMAELSLSAAAIIFGFALLFGRSVKERAVIAGAMTLWFVAVLAMGATLILYYDSMLGVPGLAGAVLIPIAALTLFGLGTTAGRERIASASLVGMSALQAVRVLGVSFVLLHAAGRLPAPFAPVAGWGDIAIGAAALPVAWWVATHGGERTLWTWNALGLLDLVAAVGLGATSSPGPIQIFTDGPVMGSAMMMTLPWILIPCFLVPALSFIHLATFWRLAKARTTHLKTGARLQPA